MRRRKTVLLLAGGAVACITAGALYFAMRKPGGILGTDPNPGASRGQTTPAGAPGAQDPQSHNLAESVTSFLGTLTPGGGPDAAGRERNYVVTYQVVFVRKAPGEKAPEESMTYKELQEKDYGNFPPYLFYGENLSGIYDPAHPDAIAVRTTIENKDIRGYIDAQKLWLEPPLAPPVSPRYMALKDETTIHVVPDAASPAALSILQGEVVDAVGKLSFKGGDWIKAVFNKDERARFGFIQARDVQPLSVATVNQSAVAADEIPRHIRDSNIPLADGDRQKLSQNGFYIEQFPAKSPAVVDDMAEAYQDVSYGEQYFITSDFFLHAYHLIFDRMLQDTEEKKLYPAVASLTGKLAKISEKELAALPAGAPPEVREGLAYDLLHFVVAAKLFDPDFVVPQGVRADVEALVARIQQGGGELPSALSSKFGDEDFTQYKVRGHYEKNESLQRYFRGMMWFGRRNFLLSDGKLTLAALLIPGLVEKAGATRAFEFLDDSLGYLVGPQDKYTLAGYRSINKKIFGTETPDAHQAAARLESGLQAFSGAVERDLPPPQIVSVQTGLGKTQEERLKLIRGFKFLGQRYTLDAFLLNQLTSPSVGTDDNPRNLPSALDVMMILGSQAAAEHQQQLQQQKKWANYESQVKKLQGTAQEHMARPSNFYDDWLQNLNSLFLPTGSKQLFTLGRPWQYKNLNAAAASWTELKHDTILYAEQSAAEMGEGGEFEIPPYKPPSPKGYVEPNPLFFERLGKSIDELLRQTKSRGFLTDEYTDKFTTFRDLARKAGSIAQKEVSGSDITAADYQWIQSLRWSFGPELLLPQGVYAYTIKDPSELRMALIADVATDAVEGRVLEVGTGTPQRITVVVKDAYGGTRLTIGYVYSWYEFPSEKRWTDAEWQKIIYAEDAGVKKQDGIQPPGWYAMFAKNPGGAN